MPMFIYVISIDFYKLLEDSGFTANAFDGKLDRVVVVAVHIVIVLVVRVIGAKDDRANAAAEMLQMKLFSNGCDV